MLAKSKKSRPGRPTEVKGGIQRMVYLDTSRLADFTVLCKEHGISVSEGIRQLIEQEIEKNAIGASNPININYNIERYISLKSNKDKPLLQIRLDRFMDTKEIRENVEAIPREEYHEAYFNLNRHLELVHARSRADELNAKAKKRWISLE